MRQIFHLNGLGKACIKNFMSKPKSPQSLFITLHLMFSLLFAFLHPVFLFLGLINQGIRNRLRFELQSDPSILLDSYDAVFEVSSEGEFEQICPLLEAYLNRQKKVLLFYASTSVDKKIKSYQNQWPYLRVSPLPLMSVFIFQTPYSRNLLRVRTKQFFFCRYDFYPHLILLSYFKSSRSYLISATLKGKKILKADGAKGFGAHLAQVIRKWYWMETFSLFDGVVAASKGEDFLAIEEVYGKGLKRPPLSRPFLVTHDFRQKQILNRLKNKDQHLSNSWSTFSEFKELIDHNHQKGLNSLIFGSAWEADLECLDERWDFSTCLTFVAPHVLDDVYLNDLIKILNNRFEKQNLPIYHWHSKLNPKEAQEIIFAHKSRPGMHLISTPQILCELYSFFSHAFVGGGFGRSIHSLLEPYMAECFLFCGPRTQRSTEYDLIINESPDCLKVVESPEKFNSLFHKSLSLIQQKDINFNVDGHKRDLMREFDHLIKYFLEEDNELT